MWTGPASGVSDAWPARTFRDWAADVGALADRLGVACFAVVGVSGGGPFGCACACELGDRITRTALISSVGPPGTMSRAHSWVARTAFSLARDRPEVLAPLLSVGAALAMRAPALMSRTFCHACRSVIARSSRPVLAQDMLEGLRCGTSGLLRDLQL